MTTKYLIELIGFMILSSTKPLVLDDDPRAMARQNSWDDKVDERPPYTQSDSMDFAFDKPTDLISLRVTYRDSGAAPSASEPHCSN